MIESVSFTGGDFGREVAVEAGSADEPPVALEQATKGVGAVDR